jgi:hypothetical protein
MTARDLAQKQRRYDILHHRSRVHTFQSMPNLSHFDRELLRQSRDALSNQGYVMRAVDLNDTRYLVYLEQLEPRLNRREARLTSCR